MGQWQRTCLACTRSCIQSLAPYNTHKHTHIHTCALRCKSGQNANLLEFLATVFHTGNKRNIVCCLEIPGFMSTHFWNERWVYTGSWSFQKVEERERQWGRRSWLSGSQSLYRWMNDPGWQSRIQGFSWQKCGQLYQLIPDRTVTKEFTSPLAIRQKGVWNLEGVQSASRV